MHWKILFVYSVEILRALRFKRSYTFLERCPVDPTVVWSVKLEDLLRICRRSNEPVTHWSWDKMPGRHFEDDIFLCKFLYENCCPQRSKIEKSSIWFGIMAWDRPWWSTLLTHISVSWPRRGNRGGHFQRCQSSALTLSGLNKMTSILLTIFSNAFKWNTWISTRISLLLVPMVSIGIKSTLVQVMVCRRTDDKSLPYQMLTHLCGAM